MTVQNPALFLGGQSHPAEDVRRWVDATLSEAGVVAAGDFNLTERDTPQMSVRSAAGRAYVRGTESTFQGAYFVEGRSTENLTIDPSDGTNDRLDLVVLQVEDGSYSGAVYAAKLAVVTGTPAGSPVEPAAPANALVLAVITVGANVTAITNADILDRRTAVHGLATSLGGIIPCTSTTRPSSARLGQPIFEEDSGRTRVFNGATWQGLAYDDALLAAVPAGLTAIWLFPTLPAGWLAIEGQTVLGAQGTYPDLWANAPAGWKSGSDLVLPNMTGRMPLHLDTGQTEFNALELLGGSKTQTLTKANLPKHAHTNDHEHDEGTTSEDSHNHDESPVSGLKGGQYPFVEGGTGRLTIDTRATAVSSNANLINEYDHDHDVTVPPHSGNTGDGTEDGLAATAFQILPPYFVVRFIIKT